jgi:hypothetical protein
VVRGAVPSTLIPWDKWDIGPRLGLAYQVANKTVIRLGYGIFYGGEENQGGSPNRGEGVPFNETVNLNRIGVLTSNINSFIGVSDSHCNDPALGSCNYFPGGFSGGYPLDVFTLPAPVSFRGVQPNFLNPLVHKWNVVVQRELAGNMALELGYEGNHQAHQVILQSTDPCPNAGVVGYSCANNRVVPNPAGSQDIGSGLSMTNSFGYGNYAAMSVKLEKRYSNGLQFLTSYVWSHALANSSTPLSGSSNFGFPDPTNLASGYSTAAWDVRHNLTTSFNYDLPFGRGKKFGANMSKPLDLLIGQWQMNGILSLRTGQPITISGTQCVGQWSRCEADVVPGANPNDAPDGGRQVNTDGYWFNPAAFMVAAQDAKQNYYTGGNLGLQSQTGPPTRTMDFSVFKNYSITERFKVQFRAEAFNLANTPIYSFPDVSLGDAKLAATPDGRPAVNGNGNFGRVQGATVGTERHVQFSLRLQF